MHQVMRHMKNLSSDDIRHWYVYNDVGRCGITQIITFIFSAGSLCYHVELMFLPNISFLLLGRRIICKKSLIHESTNNAVEILTDARHGWRKSVRQTYVVCLNTSIKKKSHTHTVDNACAICHELLGTKRIYEKLDQQGVVDSIHAHDNNTSISKYVREQRPTTINQLDNWHAPSS